MGCSAVLDWDDNPLTFAVVSEKGMTRLPEHRWIDQVLSPGQDLPAEGILGTLHCFDATCCRVNRVHGFGHPDSEPSVLTGRDSVPSLGVARSWHCASLPLHLFTDKMGQD